jgi:hypothetical protein
MIWGTDQSGAAVDPFEKTPDARGRVEPEFIPGVYHSCYICGIESARLPKEYVVTVVHTKPPTKFEASNNVSPPKYVLTYCTGCLNSLQKP